MNTIYKRYSVGSLQSENLQGLLDMGQIFWVITGGMSLICNFYILDLVDSKIVINFASE